MDPETAPDGSPDREDPVTRPAPAPRSSRPRTPARPPAPPVGDNDETREFGSDFQVGDPRPSIGDGHPVVEPRLALGDGHPLVEIRPGPRDTQPLGEPRPAIGEMPVDRAGETTVPTNIYRARRPAAAAMLVVPAVLFGLLLGRGLAVSAFGQHFDIGGIVASSLALASLPLVVAGLYGLITGAAFGAEQWGFRVWARPPLAYLLVGLALLAVAGVAVR